MLTIPNCGWTNIIIGNFSDRASYLTEVPLDCLRAMIYALSNNTDFICVFDAEGWNFKVISDNYRTFVIEEKDSCELITVENITKTILAKELYSDISDNLDKWAEWSFDLREDRNEVLKYRKCLKELLQNLNNLLTEKNSC